MADSKNTDARPKAMVTGGARGIGAAIAETLAADGFDLALTARSADSLSGTLEKVTKLGAQAVAVEMDQNSTSSIAVAVEQAVEELGGIDLLVNNAGVVLRRLALDLTPQEWDEVLDVNLKGVFFVSQQVGRHFVETARKGNIINIASVHGLVGFVQRSTYGISKAGVLHMTRMLAYEWADHGIRVNAVAPALVETDSRKEYFDARPKEREAMLKRVPLKRFVSVSDVTGAVSYLASEQGSYVTGHTIVLDGGVTSY